MNSLPTDHSSSPEPKGKTSGLLILSCPSCGHRLRLAHQHLGVEGNCVSCHTAIMGVEIVPGRFEAVKTSSSEAHPVSKLEVRPSPKVSSRPLPFGPPSMAEGFFISAPLRSPVPTPTGSSFGPGLATPREFGAMPPKAAAEPEMADSEKIGPPPETSKPTTTEPPRTASSLDARVAAKAVSQPEVPLFGPSPFFTTAINPAEPGSVSPSTGSVTPSTAKAADQSQLPVFGSGPSSPAALKPTELGLPPQTVSFFTHEPTKTAEIPETPGIAKLTEFCPSPSTETLFASEPAKTAEKPTLAASSFLPASAKPTEFSPSSFTAPLFAPKPAQAAELPDKVVSALAEFNFGCVAPPTEFVSPSTDDLIVPEPEKTAAQPETPTFGASPFFPAAANPAESEPTQLNAPLFAPEPSPTVAQSETPPLGASPFLPVAAQPREFGPPPLTDDLFASKPAKIFAQPEVPSLDAASPFLPAAAKPTEFAPPPLTDDLFAAEPAKALAGSEIPESGVNSLTESSLATTSERGTPSVDPEFSSPFSAQPNESSDDKQIEAQSFFSGSIFGPSTDADHPSPAPQITQVQTLPQASASLFGETLAARPVGESPFFAIPGEGIGEQSTAEKAPQIIPQFDPFGPPVKDDAPPVSQSSPVAEFAKNSDVGSSASSAQSKNPFVVNLTSSHHSANPLQNNRPAIPVFVPGIGTSVGTDSLNSQHEVLSRGGDEVITKKLEAGVTSTTPVPEVPAPESHMTPEPVILPKIILPKIAPPKDNLSTPRILAVLFVCSVFGGFGAYILTPYEKREEIKARIADWLEPGSVVIENLPFGR